MNSMEGVVNLCTTLHRIEEDCAKSHEQALVAKENGAPGNACLKVLNLIQKSFIKSGTRGCDLSCTLLHAASANSARIFKAFVDEAAEAASSACKAAEEAANIVINISKEMVNAERAARKSNLMHRLQVRFFFSSKGTIQSQFPCHAYSFALFL